MPPPPTPPLVGVWGGGGRLRGLVPALNTSLGQLVLWRVVTYFNCIICRIILQIGHYTGCSFMYSGVSVSGVYMYTSRKDISQNATP